MKFTLMLTSYVILNLAACTSNQSPTVEKYQGREETKKLEGASAVGYDGTAIRKNVDNTLNKNDERLQDTNKALKEEK